MIVKRRGGMTEFIPSPQEKREGLIRDHVLELVRLMHERLCLMEKEAGLAPDEARLCRDLLDQIGEEECQGIAIDLD